VATAWHREDEPDLAAEKILDAAERAFVEVGVSAAGMAKIAEYAHCSRGTLYRYFPTRHDLHLAYVNRTARRIVERVRRAIESIDDPRERLVEGILRSLREARRNPGAVAWFEPGASGIAARMSRTSEVIDTLTTTFVAELLSGSGRDRAERLGARWLVRVIVSLLAMPGDSAAEERALVERFVAPALLPSDVETVRE
jgi:AcrR family transcriptional regulator